MIPQSIKDGMYPVGRLDMYSRGALIITNNGFLTFQLTHPKYEHTKNYLVLISGNISNKKIHEWQSGLTINGYKTRKSKVIIKKRYETKTLLEVIINEGRNRQIRKTADQLGHKVLDLRRTKIADISINGLNEGSWRELKSNEWQHLIR